MQNNDDYIGLTCPFCQSVLKPGQDVAKCTQCGTFHHKECWQEYTACSMCGCKRNITLSNNYGGGRHHRSKVWIGWVVAIAIVLIANAGFLLINGSPVEDEWQNISGKLKQFFHNITKNKDEKKWKLQVSKMRKEAEKAKQEIEEKEKQLQAMEMRLAAEKAKQEVEEKEKQLQAMEMRLAAEEEKHEIAEKEKQLQAMKMRLAAEKAKTLLEEIKKHSIEKGDRKSIDLGNGVEMDFVGIPAGNFQMGDNQGGGDDDEKPVHQVNISKGFWMGKFEVTQKQFRQFINETRYKTDAEKQGYSYVYDGSSWKKENGKYWGNVFVGDDRPVVCVSWNDAKEFCKWLSEKTKSNIHLPSEAEWEYACRAGTITAFCYGNDLDSRQANFDGNYPYGNGSKEVYLKKTIAVGSFKPNAFGLYDMYGNVWEWCEDEYHSNYEGAPDDGSAWVNGSDSLRVVRGGSWVGVAGDCRSAYRSRGAPGGALYSGGFRVAFPGCF